MTITFESGDGLEVESDRIGPEHAAFLADLVSPNREEHPSLDVVKAAPDVNHDTIEKIVAYMGEAALQHPHAA